MKRKDYQIFDLRTVSSKDEIIKPDTLQDLKSVLEQAKVDWRAWKNETGKSPMSLFHQLKTGESVLVRRPGKGLTRIVAYTAICVFDPIAMHTLHYLCEQEKQTDGKSRDREARHTAVIKMYPRESELDSLVRCLRQELEFHCTRIILTNTASDEEFMAAARKLRKSKGEKSGSFIVMKTKTYTRKDPALFTGIETLGRFTCFSCVPPESEPRRLSGFEVEQELPGCEIRKTFYRWVLYKDHLAKNRPQADSIRPD